MGQSGTKFNKEELKAAVANSYSIRIDAAKQELERLQAFDLDRARSAWRDRCNEVILRLAAKVNDGSIEDTDYKRSDTFPAPPESPTHWTLSDARRTIEHLENKRDRVLALVPAFTEDDKGNVVLTSYDFKRLGIGDA